MDAGSLYAYVDADDRHHGTCLELLETHPGPLVVPTLVLTEVVDLLASRLGIEAELRFLGDLAAGTLTVAAVEPGDWMRIAELVGRYRDLPLGTVDASVVATAEAAGGRRGREPGPARPRSRPALPRRGPHAPPVSVRLPDRTEPDRPRGAALR